MKHFHVLMLLLLLMPVCLDARPKTDTIELVNGNVLNGEILSMRRAILSIDTDSMGIIKVKWPDVARIDSAYGFVVEDSVGNRFFGTLFSEPDRVLQVVNPAGRHFMRLASVINIYPSYVSVWRRFEGSMDAGYTFTKSGSRNEFNLSTDLIYRSFKWESELSLDSMLATSEGETDTDRDTATLRLIRHLGSRWHLVSFAQYQHNLELGLAHRGSVLAGIARRMIQNNNSLLSVYAGAGTSREDYTGAEPTTTGEAGIGAQYQFFRLYQPKMDISTDFILLPSLTDGGRFRSEFQVKSKVELIKNFYWSVGFYDSYDSKPPGDQNQKHDYGVTTGVGWTFG